MTKNDLKDGMVVELRNMGRYLVLGGSFLRAGGYNPISHYKEDLKWGCGNDYEVIKAFKVIGVASDLSLIFRDEHLELIWEREEKSEAEIKLDSIEKQIEELQKSAKELREEIKSK